MKYAAKIIALASFTNAATITLADPIEDLINMGLDKVGEEA